MSKNVKPIHGHAFFTLGYDETFSQILIFDYHDPAQFYYSLLRDEKAYNREMQTLLASMNELLKEEEVIINGEKVEAEALTVNLDFRGRPEDPTLTFYIEFRGELRHGEENTYECYYESGIAEYDYEVYWILPRGSKILEVVTSTEYEVYEDRFLVMWARYGDRYDGYERIKFTLPP